MKKQQTESIPESIGFFLAWILRVFTSIVLILIIAVMPFYFQEGYTHIGSDKSYFFRSGAKMLGKLILPVLLLWMACFLAAAFLRRHKGMLREWRQSFSVTDCFAFFYGLSAIFSYACSHYKSTALWGTKGWYMGLIPQLTLVVIYFLISRFQFQKAAKWPLYLCLPVSAAVFFLGYLNRFDIWPLPMENSGLPAFISTIGNINWYCGYAVAIAFVGVGLLWLDKGERRWCTALLSAYSFLGFATLITQGSDSGIFALAVVFLALFLCSVKDGERLRLKRFWLLVLLLGGAGMMTLGLRILFPGRMNYTSGLGNLLTYSPVPVLLCLAAAAGLWFESRIGEGQTGKGRIDKGRTGGESSGKGSSKAAEIYRRALHVAAKVLCFGIPAAAVIFVLMIAVNTMRPGSLGPLSEQKVFTFNNKWGSHRGATWSLGVRCFGEQDLLHKISGVGPDCMADFLYAADGDGASQQLIGDARKAFVNKRLTNAHCELLTILVDMGILGMLSFAGVIFSAAVRFLRIRRQASHSSPAAFAAACGLCVLAYTANNLWSFQQSMSVATVFVVLGMGEWFMRAEKDAGSIAPAGRPRKGMN